MTTETSALVRQMREALNCIVQWDDCGLAQTSALIENARTACSAAGHWLAAQPAPQPEKPCRCGPDGCSDSACPAKARG